MRRIIVVTALAIVAAASAQAADKFEPIAKGGGIEVYTKIDFDAGDNPFAAQGRGAVALAADADHAVSGRSLHVKRKEARGYFGAMTGAVAVRGSRGLNIAFCVRAKGMQTLSVNFFDAKKRDNTTPASPARVFDGVWRTVVFAVEDFHHNSSPPQRKVPADTEHTSLMFHGRELKGQSGEFWIDKIVIYRGVDTQAPDAPGELKATAKPAAGVALTWTEPKDNAFPAVYSIYRKVAGGAWVKIAESVQPRYTDTLAPKGTLTYRVTAADYDNNCSKPSADAAVTVTAAAKVAQAAPTVQLTDRLAYADNVRAIHARGKGKVRQDVFLFAGDSITAADSYSNTLEQWLARGRQIRRGVGMMKTGFGKNRIGKYLGSKPEFVIAMYGTNDSKRAGTVAGSVANMAAVVDACVAAGTVPVITTIPPRRFDKAKQDGQVRFNAALVKMCRAKKVPVSYCFEEMMQRDLRQMLGDGVHLKPTTGNDAAGEALHKTMQQVYFALRDTSGSW